MDKQIRITKRDLIKYGYSPNCPRCLDLEAGIPRSNRHHSDECRLRVYLNYHDHNDAKWRALESQMPGRPPATKDKEEINLDGMEPSAMEEERLPAPPTPLSTPLQADEHFQPDRRTSRMMAEEGSKPPPPMDGGEEMDVADLFV